MATSPWRPWLRATSATTALALVLGCSGELRDPTRFLQPGDGTGQTGTGGAQAAALVGTWQAFLVISVEADLQSWVTTWRFAAGGGCRFRREVTSAVEGTTRVIERECTWAVNGGVLTATFSDNGEVYPMPWSFKSLGTSILILEGLEYQRVAG